VALPSFFSSAFQTHRLVVVECDEEKNVPTTSESKSKQVKARQSKTNQVKASQGKSKQVKALTADLAAYQCLH
jgi:hypothetical protein